MLRFIVAQKEAKSQKKVTLGWQNVIILDYAEGENTDRSKAQNKNQTQAIQQYTTTYEQKKRYTTTLTKKKYTTGFDQHWQKNWFWPKKNNNNWWEHLGRVLDTY